MPVVAALSWRQPCDCCQDFLFLWSASNVGWKKLAQPPWGRRGASIRGWVGAFGGEQTRLTELQLAERRAGGKDACELARALPE